MSRRAKHRRAARGSIRPEALDAQRVLPDDHPYRLDEPLESSLALGTRLLALIRHSKAAEAIQLRLNSLTELDERGDSVLCGPRPGPRAQVTVEMLLLATLICAHKLKSYRRTDLSRALVGLHPDVARKVGLIGSDGDLIVPSYKLMLRQLLRMETVLRAGWAVVERAGHPDERRTRHDLRWLTQTLIKATIPKKQRERVNHVVVDSTHVRSWGSWLPSTSEDDVESEPVAERHKQIVEGKKDEDLSGRDLENVRFSAAEKGKKIGPDGRPIYFRDPDARVGWRSSSAEGKKGRFAGYDAHFGVAAPTVSSNGSLLKVTLTTPRPFIVSISVNPALSNYAATGARLVLEARETCENVTDGTADRGYTPHREKFVRPLHAEGINVFMDFKQQVVNKARPARLGKRRQQVVIHAGTILSSPLPKNLDVPPDGLRAKERSKAQAKWYEDRYRTYGWSPKHHFGDGRVQFRSPSNAGRATTEPASAATGPSRVPFVGTAGTSRSTISASLDELDQWQRIPYGTGAWQRAYYPARSAVESVISKIKEKGGLAHGSCQAMRLAANTISVLGLVVVHNLRQAAKAEADDGTDSDDGTERGDAPQAPNPGNGSSPSAQKARRAPP